MRCSLHLHLAIFSLLDPPVHLDASSAFRERRQGCFLFSLLFLFPATRSLLNPTTIQTNHPSSSTSHRSDGHLGTDEDPRIFDRFNNHPQPITSTTIILSSMRLTSPSPPYPRSRNKDPVAHHVCQDLDRRSRKGSHSTKAVRSVSIPYMLLQSQSLCNLKLTER